MGWEQRITVNPAVRGGKPCIKGTRITVYDVLEYLAGGMTEDQILTDFPDLTRDDIRAALALPLPVSAVWRTPWREAALRRQSQPRTGRSPADRVPGQRPRRNVGLRSSPDAEIWEYAKAQGYAIVSKDTDFRERSFLEGVPPKVVWLDVGNAATAEISELLQRERPRVESFGRSTDASVLILSLGASAV